MAGFDRSKFKATAASTLKQADKETEAVVRNKGVAAEYIDIKKDGVHKLRIYPYHPDGGGDAFAETKVVHWLSVMVPEKDGQGNIIKDTAGNKQMKLGRKPIFNSRVHGSTEKDIIEEYIKFAEKLSKDNYPGDEKRQKAFLEPIYGTPFIKGRTRTHDGILAQQSWVMYIDEIFADHKDFGRVEIGRAVKQRLNAIAASEGANDPLGTDPFTDIETGRAVNITYNSKATKPQDYWTTELDTSFDKVSQKVNLYPLSDEDIDKFLKYPSLATLFKNVYKKRDYDLALEGIKNLDDQQFEMVIDGKKETFTLGVFAYEEFLDICEEISNYYPEETASQESGVEVETEQLEEKKSVKTFTSKKDDFDDMDREDLKVYARENKTGIVITPKMPDELVRNKIREWFDQNMKAGATLKEVETVTPLRETKGVEVADDLPWDSKGQDKKKTENKEVVKKAEVVKETTKERLDRLRGKKQ
jgi:hypothetical protein